MEQVDSLGLSDRVRRKFLYENAERVLGLTPEKPRSKL